MTSRTTATLIAGPLLLALTTGCAFQQKQVEAELEHPSPINCATAKGDLRVLQSEKAHVAQQLVEGATAIYPASLVMGILTGTEGTKLSVATGEYDRMIDQRIAEIEEKCGIE